MNFKCPKCQKETPCESSNAISVLLTCEHCGFHMPVTYDEDIEFEFHHKVL